ncbi:Dabb family protein [Streptomyces malaysiensis]|uniref:Dabb family protein n=1 Tax=Streptomyces malaysiensis TaxID=92644 RepID=UPI002B2C32CA|nr:Dabb family protein [Streptomyces malaysiensis]
MLIHCVTLTFKESASAAQIEAFRDALAALPDQADFPLRICQGRDLGERPTNADYAIVAEFESTEDFYTYLKHPAHLALPQDHIESVQSVQFLVDEQG